MPASPLRLSAPFAAVFLLLAGCGREAAPPQDFRERFQQVAKDDQAVEQLLASEATRAAADPDFYILSANHWAAKAGRVKLSSAPPAPGDLTLTNASGAVVGSLGGAPDPADLAKAVAALEEGVKRFPDRLDMRFGLAHLFQVSGDAQRQAAVIEEAARAGAERGARLRWIDNQPLPKDADHFVPETIQDYTKHWLDQQTDEGAQRAFALATIAVRWYPRHAYAYNSLAGYWHEQGDLAKCFDHLIKAHDLDPADQLVVFNLGVVCTERGTLPAARKYLEQVVAATTDEELRAAAKKRLTELPAAASGK